MLGTILLFFAFLSPAWTYQELECYDEGGGRGIQIRLGSGDALIPDLADDKYNFNDRIESCNFSGVFILYDVPTR